MQNTNTKTDISSALSKTVFLSLVESCAHIMERALTYIPYETGELAKSGKVKINNETVILVDGTPETGFKPINVQKTLGKPSTEFNVEISFEKMKDGFDVALYTHEYMEGPSDGLKGPKYLSRAVNGTIGKIERKIKSSMEERLNKLING